LKVQDYLSQLAECRVARAALDRSAPFEDQISWLQAAGFKDANIAGKRHRFTVF
jgi:hypothetical protein